MEEAATNAARACDYTSTGTVEFLVWDDPNAPGGQSFAFLEMNTRLQVEHPVTELVRGVDLVQDQLRIAGGLPLGYTAAERPIRGWAMECRITAEDPFLDFAPSVGPIAWYREADGPGVRLDSMLARGIGVSPYYDSLISKLITWGETREQCIRRMKRALGEYLVIGVSTSIPFHQALMDDENFRNGDIHTLYVEENEILDSAKRPANSIEAALAAAMFFHTQGERADAERSGSHTPTTSVGPVGARPSISSGAGMAKNYRLIVQGGLQEVAIDDNGNGHFRAEVDGQTYEVELESVDDNTLFRLWVDGERIPIAIRREGMTLEVFIGPDRYSAEIERSAGALTQTGPAIEGEVRLTAR